MNKKVSNTITYIFFLSLGILLLWLCFRKIEFSQVLDYVRTAKYSWMLISLACLGISLFFRALRWNILIESLGYKTRVSTTYESVLIAYFANTVFPRLGEVQRAQPFAQGCHILLHPSQRPACAAGRNTLTKSRKSRSARHYHNTSRERLQKGSAKCQFSFYLRRIRQLFCKLSKN